MNPIGGQSDPREQQRRLKLQEERSRDMKEFLASQAAMAHPRLKRLLKNRDEPLQNAVPIQPQPTAKSYQNNTALPTVPPNAEKLPSILPNNTNPTPVNNTLYNPQPMFQPYQPPQIPNYGMYADPRVNMAMPPPFYPINWGYHNYQLPQPNTQPDSAFNLYGTYPRDNFRPKEPHHFQYNDRGESIRSESRNSSQNLNLSDRNYTGKKYQSKEQYAKELDRQIAEKAKQKQAEKQKQLEPINPVKTRNLYNKYNNNFIHERAENPDFHERVQQQSKYLKDLDEQIRVKNEMLQRQKLLERREDSEIYGVKEFKNSSPYSTGAPELFHHSRKQFPDQQAKIYHSEVFPSISNRSPSLNQYSALPPIGANVLINNEYSPSRMMEQRSHNLSMNSSFPPSNLTFDKVLNNQGSNVSDPAQTKYLRGAMQLEDMPAWQKEEFLAKEQMKQKNQRDIQMQIAEKERQKQIQLEKQKIEDEKERIRIENELNLMREQYKREQEEDRKKAEMERLENERIQKEKLEKERQAEMLLKEPLTKPKRVVRHPSPEPEHERDIPAPQFRSNSPPIPAVLKKMKEEGIIAPDSNTTEQVKESTQNITNSPPIRSKHTESLKQQSAATREPAESEPSMSEIKTKSSLKETSATTNTKVHEPKVEEYSIVDSNHEILEQLAAIQRELESENHKLRQDMEQDVKPLVKDLPPDPLLAKVESMERDIERIKSRSAARKPRTPYESMDPQGRNSISSKFRKLKTPIESINASKELFTTETEIMDISNNLNLNSDIFMNANDFNYQSEEGMSPAKKDDFNIEEIEQRNEARLRKINLRAKTPKLNDKELLENFMNGPKKTSIFSKLKKLTGSQPLSSTSTEELSSKLTQKQKKKSSLTSLNKNEDSASNSQIITKSQPVLASENQKPKILVSSLHSLDVNQSGNTSLQQIVEEPKSATGTPSTTPSTKSQNIEQVVTNGKGSPAEESKITSSSPISSDASMKIQSKNLQGPIQKDSPLQMRKVEDKTGPNESASSIKESVKMTHVKTPSPSGLTSPSEQLLSPTLHSKPENPSPLNSARPSRTEKGLANGKLAEKTAANELTKIVTQNINTPMKSPESAKILSAISSHSPSSPLSQSVVFDTTDIVSPVHVPFHDRGPAEHHKASRSEQWPSRSEVIPKPFLSQQNSAHASGMNTPARSMRFDSTGSQNTVNMRVRAGSSSQSSSHAPVVNRGRADSSAHTVQQQMKLRNELQRPRAESIAQASVPSHLRSESGSARSSVKSETPEELLNRLRHAATQVKPAAQTSQQTMVDVTKNQSATELGSFRKNSSVPPPKPIDPQNKPQSPFDKTPSGKNILQNAPPKPVLPGKNSPASSAIRLETSQTVKSLSPFANNMTTDPQSYVPSTPTKTLESQLQSLRNRSHSSSFGSPSSRTKDVGLRNETKGLTTINSVNNSADCLNAGSGQHSIRSAKSSQPGSISSVDNLTDKPTNEFAVEDNPHLVQCFKSEEDGLFKLSYGCIP
ncbi:hypothetical protein HK103_006869 [Boothiomyces macroporosus]|uniref:Uncharacterized protein n=1 Tax=Boothiomyces macroporosus TaxID=261099 RepID=A0AAD5UCV9_9FUNG|nr:hypothetical protein HK103_006869 [Boothiomyces macroporosus]